jgi:hypothetical protein
VLRRLQVLDEIGLGYLRLGQPATTLSGGEAQRIKIAAHLASHGGERLLYILDEPTTGLHFDDIAKLLAAFRKLLEAGHTLAVIEHNLDVIKTADWIIDLGPEGGEEGGEVIAMGTPEQVAYIDASHTGRYLDQILQSARVLQTVEHDRVAGLTLALALLVGTGAARAGAGWQRRAAGAGVDVPRRGGAEAAFDAGPPRTRARAARRHRHAHRRHGPGGEHRARPQRLRLWRAGRPVGAAGAARRTLGRRRRAAADDGRRRPQRPVAGCRVAGLVFAAPIDGQPPPLRPGAHEGHLMLNAGHEDEQIAAMEAMRPAARDGSRADDHRALSPRPHEQQPAAGRRRHRGPRAHRRPAVGRGRRELVGDGFARETTPPAWRRCSRASAS